MTATDFPSCDLCGEPLIEGELVAMQLACGNVVEVCDGCAPRCPGKVSKFLAVPFVLEDHQIAALAGRAN